jgi:hypothetical protein
MNKLIEITTTVLLVGITLFASQAGAITRTVDCEKGQSIQNALDKGQSNAEPLVIIIRGTCDESVTIVRDDVTLLGIDDNAGISSTTDISVSIEGGQRIRIEKLTLSGPDIPLSVDSAYVTLVDVTIEGSNDNGIDAVDGSNVNIEDSRIRNNGLTGIVIEKGGTLNLYNTVVSGNARGGVTLSKNSSSVITNSEIFENLNGPGVSIGENSTAKFEGTTVINGNGTNGISIILHSIARVFSPTVISGNSQNGLFLVQDSGADIIGPVTIGDNANSAVYCNDAESSIAINDYSNINQAVVCTGF